jgi:hypothetical protein
MSKKKVINGKDYRWDYQKKKWVQSHGGSGGEAIAGLTRSVVGLFNRDKAKIKKNDESNGKSNGKKSKLTFKNMKEAGMLDKKSKSTTASKKSADSEKADWLKKTRNSPAAKSGAFTDEQRWAQHVKHRDSQAARKAKTEAKKNKLKATQGKSMPSNPKGMRQEGVGKTAKDLTRHTTGSSETKKKKKKKLTKNEIKYPTRGTFRGI